MPDVREEPLSDVDRDIVAALTHDGPMTCRVLADRGPHIAYYDRLYSRLKSLEKRGLVRRGAKVVDSNAIGSQWTWEVVR